MNYGKANPLVILVVIIVVVFAAAAVVLLSVLSPFLALLLSYYHFPLDSYH